MAKKIKKEEIITSELFFNEGLNFPPSVSVPRLKGYRHLRTLYNGDYLNNRDLVVRGACDTEYLNNTDMGFNLFKLIVDKGLGLLFKEKPIIRLDDANITDIASKVIENTNMLGKLQEALWSYMVLGDGVLYTNTSTRSVSSLNPEFYFKVVNPYDIGEVVCHKIIHKIFSTSIVGGTIKSVCTHLRIVSHYKGYYTEFVHEYTGTGTIGKAVDYHDKEHNIFIPKEGLKCVTGLTDFAIQTIHNSKVQTSVFGESDYKHIEKLVKSYDTLLILSYDVAQEYCRPLVILPNGNFHMHEDTGEVEVRTFKHFLLDSGDDNHAKKMEFDAHLSDVKATMETILDNIVTLVEWGRVVLFGEYHDNTVESIKAQSTGAIDKTTRILNSIDHQIKSTVVSLLQANGVYECCGEPLSTSHVYIDWQDGIEESIKLVSDVATKLTEGGILSVKTALQRFYHFSEDQTNDELEQLNVERLAKINANLEAMQLGASLDSDNMINGTEGLDNNIKATLK